MRRAFALPSPRSTVPLGAVSARRADAGALGRSLLLLPGADAVVPALVIGFCGVGDRVEAYRDVVIVPSSWSARRESRPATVVSGGRSASVHGRRGAHAGGTLPRPCGLAERVGEVLGRGVARSDRHEPGVVGVEGAVRGRRGCPARRVRAGARGGRRPQKDVIARGWSSLVLMRRVRSAAAWSAKGRRGVRRAGRLDADRAVWNGSAIRIPGRAGPLGDQRHAVGTTCRAACRGSRRC